MRAKSECFARSSQVRMPRTGGSASYTLTLLRKQSTMLTFPAPVCFALYYSLNMVNIPLPYHVHIAPLSSPSAPRETCAQSRGPLRGTGPQEPVLITSIPPVKVVARCLSGNCWRSTRMTRLALAPDPAGRGGVQLMVPSRVPFCLFTSEHTLVAAVELQLNKVSPG